MPPPPSTRPSRGTRTPPCPSACSPEQVEAYFEGLDLLDPGIVPLPYRRPDPSRVGEFPEAAQYGGVVRKP
ncbi:SAM-dependent methyltransferase [Nocardiopsis listeri]|uniref:SAM-dependent methyltransferase n=1 Tax=Nocardiopsis listeri TaxID=53440 RepID=UPI0012EEB7D0|nr:SAM-dependent methyltransferase [Nocardiopsis listeri]